MKTLTVCILFFLFSVHTFLSLFLNFNDNKGPIEVSFDPSCVDPQRPIHKRKETPPSNVSTGKLSTDSSRLGRVTSLSD